MCWICCKNCHSLSTPNWFFGFLHSMNPLAGWKPLCCCGKMWQVVFDKPLSLWMEEILPSVDMAHYFYCFSYLNHFSGFLSLMVLSEMIQFDSFFSNGGETIQNKHVLFWGTSSDGLFMLKTWDFYTDFFQARIRVRAWPLDFVFATAKELQW